MSTALLIFLFIAHFIADFLLQDRDMAQNKSRRFSVLVRHAAIHWLVVLGCAAHVLPPLTAILLTTINALLHGLVDWFIWKAYKAFAIKRAKDYQSHNDEPHPLMAPDGRTWRYWEDSWFFKTIGLDQLLHMLGLLAAYNLALIIA
jgi:hypothetical protein